MGIPDCSAKYRVARMLTQIELKKLKKDFLNLSKLHPPKGGQKKGMFEAGYVEFLNSRLTD